MSKIAGSGWNEVRDFETLKNLKFDPQGPKHVPVPHYDAIEFFKARLAEHKIEVIREQAVLSPDTMKLMYVADVRPDGKAEDGFIFSIGFINNNDRSKAFTGIAGTTVYINNVQMYISDNSFKTRHTTTVREMLMDRSAHIIDWFNQYYFEQTNAIKKMKNTPITDSDVGRLIMNFHRKKYVLCAANINRIVKEWDKPTHEEFKDRNLWSLMNCCGEVFKRIKSPLMKLEANEIFYDTFGII